MSVTISADEDSCTVHIDGSGGDLVLTQASMTFVGRSDGAPESLLDGLTHVNEVLQEVTEGVNLLDSGEATKKLAAHKGRSWL